MTNKTSILNIFMPVIKFISSHTVFIFIVIFLVLAGYLLNLTNQLVGTLPTQDDINAKLRSVPKPTIDSNITKTIMELEDRNTNIQTIFKEARQNPFSE